MTVTAKYKTQHINWWLHDRQRDVHPIPSCAFIKWGTIYQGKRVSYTKIVNLCAVRGTRVTMRNDLQSRPLTTSLAAQKDNKMQMDPAYSLWDNKLLYKPLQIYGRHGAFCTSVLMIFFSLTNKRDSRVPVTYSSQDTFSWTTRCLFCSSRLLWGSQLLLGCCWLWDIVRKF